MVNKKQFGSPLKFRLYADHTNVLGVGLSYFSSPKADQSRHFCQKSARVWVRFKIKKKKTLSITWYI